jgi:hypothetical protein
MAKKREGMVDMRKEYPMNPSGHLNDKLVVMTTYSMYNPHNMEFSLVRHPSNTSMGEKALPSSGMAEDIKVVLEDACFISHIAKKKPGKPG